MLRVAHGIVSRITDGAPGESGKLRQMNRAVLSQKCLEITDGVGRLELAGRFGPAGIGNDDLRSPRLEGEERLAAEETVATDFFAANDALEEKRRCGALDPCEGTDRSQAI